MPLSKALSKKARCILKEDPSRVQDDIKYIKDWILQQPHLKARTEDEWVLKFLRGCKFSYEKTKLKIDRFYTYRSALPEFYSNRDPFSPEIQEALKTGCFLPLLRTDGEDGGRVVVVRCKNVDTAKLTFQMTMKVSLMIIDILLYEDDNFLIGGQYGLIDLEGSNINHVLHFDLNACRKAVQCLQESYPLRPQGVHIVNTMPFFEAVLESVKLLVKRKIADRLCVYSNSEGHKFGQMFPKYILPKEYGGESLSFAELTDYWKKKVESYKNWFMEDMQYGCDETKRPVSDKNNDLFGISGSFKSINID